MQCGRWLSSSSRYTGALPVLPAGTDGQAVVGEIARLAVCGRARAEVVQVTAPEVADVTGLGVRASDGESIYLRPNAERYCTLAALDTEERILAAAKRTVPWLIGEDRARRIAGPTDLTAAMVAVVVMLTATIAAAVLVAPAGRARPIRWRSSPDCGRRLPAGG